MGLFVGFLGVVPFRWSLACELPFAFLVRPVDVVGELPEFQKRSQLSDPGNFVLDLVQKSMIVIVAEGGLIPMELHGEAIELNVVLGNTVQVHHAEMVDLHFHISGWVERSKVGLEFPKEQVPVFKPVFFH